MMNIYYVNSRGDKIDFLSGPYRLQTCDLFDYSWEYETITLGNNGEKLTGFKKGIMCKKVLLGVEALCKKEYYDALNFFHNTTEIDVINKIQGKLCIGNYYLKCYIISSVKTEWEYDINVLDNEVMIVTDKPFWIRETEYNFKYNDIFSGSNKKYAYRYPYRYANGLKDTSILNDHYDSVHFRMIMYGPCVNPQVNIEGHPYFVNTILETGEYITVDSMKKTVIKTMMNGTEVNLFHYRGRNIFDRILPGRHTVSFGKFDFDLVLIRERSEPEWQ